jgi:hypothetical protein
MGRLSRNNHTAPELSDANCLYLSFLSPFDHNSKNYAAANFFTDIGSGTEKFVPELDNTAGNVSLTVNIIQNHSSYLRFFW